MFNLGLYELMPDMQTRGFMGRGGGIQWQLSGKKTGLPQ